MNKILEKTKKKPKRYGWIIAASILLLCLILPAGFFGLLHYFGKKHIEADTVSSVSEMTMNRKGSTEELRRKTDVDPFKGTQKALHERIADEREAAVQEGWEEKEGRVFYKGRVYDFNTDIMTFLCMGIDQESETVQEYTEGFDAGSSDALFLVVLDPRKRKLEIITIDRNTMAEVDIYDYYGNYEETVLTQICVQHGFGDGTKKSAAYCEKAVSRYLYGLPINGYCAMNMSAIPKINDAVGGVDVEVLEDLTKADPVLTKGARIHLEGEHAFWYLKYRDVDLFKSAEGRHARQRQYVAAYIKKAKEAIKADPMLAVHLFQSLQPYMTTDITVDKAGYLAGLAVQFDFSKTGIRKVPGQTVMGEIYEEFYTDEVGKYEMMLDVFYDQVGEYETADKTQP